MPDHTPSQLLAETSALLLGRRAGVSRALTWVPRALLDPLGADDSTAEALARLCDSAGVRLAFVPTDTWTRRAVEELTARGIAAACVIDGVFGRAARRMGWSAALAASAREHRELEGCLCEAAAEAVAESGAALDMGASAIVIADDLAGSSGMMVDPDFAANCLLPHYSAIAALWVEAGKPVIFHSDGDIRHLYRDLAAIGFSATHLAPGADTPSVEEMMAAAAHAGLCPIGGLRAAEIDAEGAQESQRRVTAQLAASGAKRAFIADDGSVSTASQLGALLGVHRLFG